MITTRIKIPGRKADAHKANALLNQLIDLLANLDEPPEARAQILNQAATIIENTANEIHEPIN